MAFLAYFSNEAEISTRFVLRVAPPFTDYSFTDTLLMYIHESSELIEVADDF